MNHLSRSMTRSRSRSSGDSNSEVTFAPCPKHCPHKTATRDRLQRRLWAGPNARHRLRRRTVTSPPRHRVWKEDKTRVNGCDHIGRNNSRANRDGVSSGSGTLRYGSAGGEVKPRDRFRSLPRPEGLLLQVRAQVIRNATLRSDPAWPPCGRDKSRRKSPRPWKRSLPPGWQAGK